jgi:hypothetical protein
VVKRNITIVITACLLLIDTLTIALCLNIVPLVLNRQVFVYEYGTEISNNVSTYITANTTVIKDSELDISKVKDEVGIYNAKVVYGNKDYDFKIKIVDTTKPKVTLKATTFNYVVGETIKPTDLIESIDDKSEVTAYFVNSKDEKLESLKYDKVGSHIVLLTAVDNSGNETAKLRAKIVVSSYKIIKPTIIGIEDKEIVKGDKFDPLEGVKATDGNGNDITSSIQVLKNDVDINKEGKYTVIYYVKNSSGQSTQQTRIIKVVKED